MGKPVIFNNVNEDVNVYFKKWGKSINHKLMEKVRMREVFHAALNHIDITPENAAIIRRWLVVNHF